MITDRNTLFYRYWNALNECDDGDVCMQPGAVRLALRLAIDDVIATYAVALKQPSTADRVAEYQQAQISRLNDWLQVHEPGLYISPGDTADATLAALGYRDKRIAGLLADLEQLQTDADAECAELQEDLTSARNELSLLIAERDSLRQQLVEMDADNARLITSLAERTNGNGANPTTTPAWNRDHPAWTALPAADLDVIDQLSSGLTTFRRLNRTLRRDLVLRVIRHLAGGHGELKLSLYDAQKPTWMPTAGAVIMLSETGRWLDLVTMALEPATA